MVISSHRNRRGRNHVAVSITRWSGGDDSTHDISKLFHREHQGDTAPIFSNTKGIIWITTQCTTVLQEVGGLYWDIWVTDQPIRPICVKRYYNQQTHDGIMSCVKFKGVTCPQLWNHQVFSISVNHLYSTHSAQGKSTWLFRNLFSLHRTSNSEVIHDKIPR